MKTDFKLKCIQDISLNISLPAKGSVVINSSNIRLCYQVTGAKVFTYINLATQEEAAIFLRRHGKIAMYSISNGQVKMFTKQLDTTEVQHRPQQHEKMVELPWSAISFTQGEVLHYCAENEYRIQCQQIGLSRARIIKFTTEIFRAA